MVVTKSCKFCNFINYNKFHWLEWSPKPWQRLQCVLQMVVGSLCLTVVSLSFVHLNQKFKIYHSIRPIDTDFKCSFWVTWHTLDFFLSFFLHTNAFFSPTLPPRPFLTKWTKSDNWRTSLRSCVRFFLFLTDMTFRKCSSDAGSLF